MSGRPRTGRATASRGQQPGAPLASVHSLQQARIQRALRDRVRYRYVKPAVHPEGTGWRIESPCCSRNVDPDGGVIDIALLQPVRQGWKLLARDHVLRCWVPHSQATRLEDLLVILCQDPQRRFWP